MESLLDVPMLASAVAVNNVLAIGARAIDLRLLIHGSGLLRRSPIPGAD
jgi:hypothetical protein